MKSLALSTALIATLAAPAAFASDSLARSLGVEPGQFTTAELIELRTAIEDNDVGRIDFLLNGHANPVPASVAYQARLWQAISDDDVAAINYLRATGPEVISTQGTGHSQRAQEIFAQIDAE